VAVILCNILNLIKAFFIVLLYYSFDKQNH